MTDERDVAAAVERLCETNWAQDEAAWQLAEAGWYGAGSEAFRRYGESCLRAGLREDRALVRAQRERDAQVCRERATRARDYPQSQAGYKTAMATATAREAEACAEAIMREG